MEGNDTAARPPRRRARAAGPVGGLTRLTVGMPPETARRLDQAADRYGVAVSVLMREAALEGMDKVLARWRRRAGAEARSAGGAAGKAAAVALLLAALAAGCGGGGLPPNAERLTEAGWTDGPWPFTVDAGVLRCRGIAVTFETEDGTVYPVNGAAKGRPGVEPETHPIWRLDPRWSDGGRISIGPMIKRGLSLCD